MEFGFSHYLIYTDIRKGFIWRKNVRTSEDYEFHLRAFDTSKPLRANVEKSSCWIRLAKTPTLRFVLSGE